MIQTRTCACARRAPHAPPDRTSVRAAQIHPSPALASVGWAVGAIRLAAVATLATRARLASACSILHNGPPARTRVRPPLLDLCHGTGRSSHAAAPAIVLGAYLSTHRARRVACHKPVSSSLRCYDSNASNAQLCSRTACSTRASLPHERAGGSNPPFPRPSHCWLGGGRRPPCGGGDTCNTSTPRFGVLDPSQRAARKDACAALSTRPVPRHGSF